MSIKKPQSVRAGDEVVCLQRKAHSEPLLTAYMADSCTARFRKILDKRRKVVLALCHFPLAAS